MFKYKLSNSAKEDLIRIHQYGIYKFGLKQADKYFNELFNCFDRIVENPYYFESIDHIREGYRRCPSGSDTIYYRVKNKEVEIMAIVGRQDLNNKLK
ncbi:MAG: type II toxin-antitoxin system RelE/ParE family toxin [Saprospiraceae bacterium]|nr:type II toxin-antitoxin system RelE/ParE family toxin [Saprospiraceae bacterium]